MYNPYRNCYNSHANNTSFRIVCDKDVYVNVLELCVIN